MVPSFTSTKGYAASSRGQLHFIEAGSGPVLVMVPHAGRSARMYADVVPLLARNFRVIVFDVPGTGLSFSPPPGDISISDLADCLLDGLDDLKVGRFSVFGLHGGNKVGASIVARHGDRVEKFIYAGQSHSIIVSKQKRDAVFAATPSIAAVVSAEEALADSPVMWSREFRELADIWWQDAAVDHPDLAHRLRVVDRAVDSLQAFLWRPFFYRAAYAYDMEADLRRIRVPTLILELATPKEDREVGRQGSSLLEVIAGSELVTLESPDTLAVTLEDRAAELAAIVREFLTGGAKTR